MKKARKILVLIMTLFLFFGCNKNNEISSSSDQMVITEEVDEGLDKASDEDLKKSEIAYTDDFSIKYLENGIKLVKDGEDRELLLVPKGQEIPGEFSNTQVIYTPVENVLFASTTQLGALVPFDIWDSIGGVMQERDVWQIDKVKELLDEGTIKYVGNSSDPDFEAIQELNPDITFVYTGTSPQSDLIAKLDELGLTYAVDNEYMEESYEARMEWVKFLGTFFNKDDEVNEYFQNQLIELDDMKNKVKGLEKPKVAWGMVYDGVVYVPAKDSYVAKMVEDAGGDYIFDAEGVSSAQISLEDFYLILEDADIWIYPSTSEYLPDLEALLEKIPVAADTEVVNNGNIRQISLDYYQNIYEAHKQVIDLAAIFHPNEFEGYNVHYFPELAK